MAKRKTEMMEPVEYQPEPSVNITLPKAQQGKMVKSLNLDEEVEVTFKGKIKRFELDETCCHMTVHPSDIKIETAEGQKSMDDAVEANRRRR